MGPTARIDLSALRHNLRRVRELAPGSRTYAVVKANAYGHGLLRVAAALDESDGLAVARVEEAVLLRDAGIEAPLLVLEGFADREEMELSSRHRLEVAIQQPEQIGLLRQFHPASPLVCWLKVDSGMHRLGFQPEAVEAAWLELSGCSAVAPGLRLITHFSSADDPADTRTREQLARFGALRERYRVDCSMANSAGIIGWPESHGEWVRPGIMLYGASPMQGRTGGQEGLRPVMTLGSRLLAINHYRKGSPIGYGGSWVCPEDMPVGVVAAGYGDGYPRHAPAGTPVLVNGRPVPLVGRVSMDMLNVDLRTQPQAQVGDPVILWGEGLPAEQVAQAAGTIAYELFCSVTQRVRFEPVGE